MTKFYELIKAEDMDNGKYLYNLTDIGRNLAKHYNDSRYLVEHPEYPGQYEKIQECKNNAVIAEYWRKII